MTRVWEGKPNARGMRMGIVVSRFNSTVTDRLLEGALEGLERCQVADEDIDVIRVPGAFEIPLAAKRLAASGRVAAVVCLSAIIKGGTAHWDFLSRTVTDAIAQASLESGIPMTNAVLTTETMDLAVERAGRRGTPGSSNKGFDAALAACEMADLFRALEPSGPESPGSAGKE